jgi:hypothetical protein
MPTTTRVKHFTSSYIIRVTTIFAVTAAAVALTAAPSAHAEWTVDFSRRSQQTRSDDLRAPASSTEMPIAIPTDGSGSPVVAMPPQSQPPQQQPGFFESLFQSGEVAQEIVVLNTDKGFVPSTIRVKKGLNYQIHVVNVNDKEKNVSFVLDSFSEHHATYYGKIKSFVIHPQKEGVYKFVSPETSAQGKLVVYPAAGADNRAPASAD